jgi:hypothetical protein
MNQNNLNDGEYAIISGTFTKEHGLGEWSFEVRGVIDTANYTNEDLLLVVKSKIQDLKDENDQCILEIAKLQREIEVLKAKNTALNKLNNNQAISIMGNTKRDYKQYNYQYSLNC